MHKKRVHLKFPVCGRKPELDGEMRCLHTLLWKNPGGGKGNLRQSLGFEMSPLLSLVRHQIINPGP